MKKFFALFVAVMMLLCAFSAVAEEGDFPEYPVGPVGIEENDQQVGFMNIATVYFQPVDMKPAGMSLAKEDATCHIEADISCIEDPFGFGIGGWVPYLTINYVVTDKDGNVVVGDRGPVEGSFMPMNASDGPHYGANICLPDGEGYTLTLTILSPAENGFLLHVDPETGVEGDFERDWAEPYVCSWTDWDFTNIFTK